MGCEESKSGHGRDFSTQRYLDPAKNPPEYIDRELQVVTVKMLGAERRGAYVKSQQGTDSAGPLIGSYMIGGSHYDFAPGTYSLRITRLNVGVTVAGNNARVGTPDFGPGTIYAWVARHSREGTLMVLQFPEPAQVNLAGNWDNPIMSMGPGTFIYQHLGDRFAQVGTKVDLSMNLEGVVG